MANDKGIQNELLLGVVHKLCYAKGEEQMRRRARKRESGNEKLHLIKCAVIKKSDIIFITFLFRSAHTS